MKNKMMIFILSLLILNSINGFANNDTTSVTDGFTTNIDTTYLICDTLLCSDTCEYNNGAFLLLEEPALFPGGEDALQKFVSKNMQYPTIAKTHGIEGRVYVILALDEKGAVENITFLNNIGGGCEDEVLRVLSEMPLWEPKKINGNQVKSERYFSFTFKL